MIPIKELEALLLYWKDNRSNKGLWFDHLEKVNTTIIILEDVRDLLKSGIVKFATTNHENYRHQHKPTGEGLKRKEGKVERVAKHNTPA